jgi:hypothetical protein
MKSKCWKLKQATKSFLRRSSPIQTSLSLESLEKRTLLAVGLPWHNLGRPLDVNNDGIVSPIDPLIVINELNQKGPRELPASGVPLTRMVDTSGDGYLSPLDRCHPADQLPKSKRPGLCVRCRAAGLGRRGWSAGGNWR